MDRFIRHLNWHADEIGDLRVNTEHGLAWQDDFRVTVAYDAAYLEKCASHPPAMVAEINAARRSFVNQHVGGMAAVVDVGIGDGAFIRSRPCTFGLDINPAAQAWLREVGRQAGGLAGFRGVTMWDTLEHVPDPGQYLDQIGLGDHLFVSVPIFEDLAQIRSSHHYRPGEHLYYFTHDGLITWLGWHGFQFLEVSDFESRCGRANIGSYAFRRDRWPDPQSPSA